MKGERGKKTETRELENDTKSERPRNSHQHLYRGSGILQLNQLSTTDWGIVQGQHHTWLTRTIDWLEIKTAFPGSLSILYMNLIISDTHYDL